VTLRDSAVVSTRSLLLVLAASVVVGVSCADDGSGAGADDHEGKVIATRAGCTACHGVDGQGGIGPAWVGSLGTEIELTDGTTVTVDERYLEAAIKDPRAQVHDGFSVDMPENRLTEQEIAEVVDYIVALNANS
jgi:cytochrome c oxidase subunit 2